MATADIVTDHHLVAVLKAAAQARSQCEQILTLIAEQKQDGTAAAQEQKKLLSSLAVVRGLNRRAVLGVRETKQKTAEARSEVDTLHLQLQNLYYEQRHLNGEIAVCEGFDHPYQRLPLIPAEEYLELRPEHAELSEQELMRERIEHEHAERVQLEEARQALLKQKQTLITENNKRKEVLASLDKKIEDWIESSGAVDKEFASCSDEMGKIGVKSKEEGVVVSTEVTGDVAS